MRVKSVIFIFLLLFFCSCGRKHPGVIINDTDEILLVTLKLNQYTPDNYLYDDIDIILNYKSQPGEAKSIGDYVIRFDSISNIAVLKLSPSDKNLSWHSKSRWQWPQRLPWMGIYRD